MNSVRYRVDAEMGLLVNPGSQNLYSEDPSKNTYNDNRLFRADGGDDFSNAVGKNGCKERCQVLFMHPKDSALKAACNLSCDQKCKSLSCHGYRPTRELICASQGLNANCTPKSSTPPVKTTDVGVEELASKTLDGKSGVKPKISPVVKYTMVGVAVILIAGTIWYIKRKK